MRSMVEGAEKERSLTVRTFQPTFRRAQTLRRDMTLPEVMLWECLRGKRLEGLRFRRQHPIGPYVLDFYCAAAKLAVEVDGIQHDHPGQIAHDRRRDAWLSRQKIRVMRIAAADVLNDVALEGILVMISKAAAVPPPPPPSAVPLPRFAGEDQP